MYVFYFILKNKKLIIYLVQLEVQISNVNNTILYISCTQHEMLLTT